jgi:hypothetical protein
MDANDRIMPGTENELPYGHSYQLLRKKGKLWKHCCYAETPEDVDRLLNEYRMTHHDASAFMVALLPKKSCKKEEMER